MMFEKIGTDIGKLVEEKNKAYGNSFKKSGEFLQLLYPSGIRPDQYQDVLSLVRIFDKQMRIATDKNAYGENPYRDIAEVMYESVMQRLYATKLELQILDNQYRMMMKGE